LSDPCFNVCGKTVELHSSNQIINHGYQPPDLRAYQGRVNEREKLGDPLTDMRARTSRSVTVGFDRAKGHKELPAVPLF
jgi:hypothetical protein